MKEIFVYKWKTQGLRNYQNENLAYKTNTGL
jgi:hypothetical protein